MTTYGYARVSRKDQSLEPQINALLDAGCFRHNIYADKFTGSIMRRPALDECLGILKPGDTLVVYRLDRFGRSTQDLIKTVTLLASIGVMFKSIQEGVIDTSSANGKLVFELFATLANFERNLLIERTKAGLEVARANGRVGGRPRLKTSDEKVLAAKQLKELGTMTPAQICEAVGIKRATYYKYLKYNLHEL